MSVHEWRLDLIHMLRQRCGFFFSFSEAPYSRRPSLCWSVSPKKTSFEKSKTFCRMNNPYDRQQVHTTKHVAEKKYDFFRRFWVKKPRRPENVSAKKVVRLYLCRSERQLGTVVTMSYGKVPWLTRATTEVQHFFFSPEVFLNLGAEELSPKIDFGEK